MLSATKNNSPCRGPEAILLLDPCRAFCLFLHHFLLSLTILFLFLHQMMVLYTIFHILLNNPFFLLPFVFIKKATDFKPVAILYTILNYRIFYIALLLFLGCLFLLHFLQEQILLPSSLLI